MNQRQREPIAIIGMGCRFPGGADSPEKFWALLEKGVDAIVDIPPDRWDLRRFYDPDPQKPGKAYIRQGGFLQERITDFEPEFFGISPREAAAMDPQQRLLLEVAWEALEDAGLPLDNLRGKDVGVFIGGFTLDNQVLQFRESNRHLINPYTATGVTMSILAARISYVFDFQGPCVSLDTACSSSLTALHHACQSLWNEESSLAVVGGVNVMFMPEYAIAMCQGQFLAPDARCKTFDARANGYARGEGAGIVILKPLARSLEDGDRIHALVRGTGINQDGRTTGISHPNRSAQEALIRQVYRQTGITSAQIQYVEAHGTGTKAGDLAETAALGAAIGREKAGSPTPKQLVVGSVKTNIGHLEAAAGMASLVKTTLCLQKKRIPPNLHFETPNPEIPFEELGIRVPQRVEVWPEHEGPAMAGINSFGYGGSNVHVVLEEAPRDLKKRNRLEHGSLLLPISAASEDALKVLAGRYLDLLSAWEDEDPNALYDLCFSAGTRRTHHPYRQAIVFTTKAELMEKLRRITTNQPAEGTFTGRVVPNRTPKIMWVYSGMGPQWWYMGRELLLTQPVFEKAFQECDTIFRKYSGWSLRDEFFKDETDSRFHEATISQPANFVLQVALTALWESWGLKPKGIVGHSVGEVTAAYVSGALSLEDALKLCYYRSSIQQKLAGQGRMLAAELSEARARELLAGLLDQVSLAAINGPEAVVFSGVPEALQAIATMLEKENIFHRFTRVDIAYHSQQLEAVKSEILARVQGVTPRPTRVPLYSTVIGGLIEGSRLDQNYWWQNARQTVLFEAAIAEALQDGFNTFIEIGPHPVLSGYLNAQMQSHGVEGVVIASQRRERPQWETLLNALSLLYVSGYPLSWNQVYPPGTARYIPLPSYPWQRKSYFLESDSSREDRLGPGRARWPGLSVKSPRSAWEMELTPGYFPYLQDHQIRGKAVFPGAGYVEIGLAVAQSLNQQRDAVIEDLRFHCLFILDQSQVIWIHTDFNSRDNAFTIYSAVGDERRLWNKHTTGRIVRGKFQESGGVLDIERIRSRCSQAVNVADLYGQFRARGLEYGPQFQSLQGIRRGQAELLALIELPMELRGDHPDYRIHPVILDASFQALLALILPVNGQEPLFLPARVERVCFYRSPGAKAVSYIRMTAQSADSFSGDLTICDENFQVCLELKGICLRALPMEGLPTEESNRYYESQWRPVPVETPGELSTQGTWLVFSEKPEFNEACQAFFPPEGKRIIFVAAGDDYQEMGPGAIRIRPGHQEDMERLIRRTDNCCGVIYLWSLERSADDGMAQAGIDHCVTVLFLTQALNNQAVQKVSLRLVTQGAHSISEQDPVRDLSGCSLWGLGRVIMNEHSDWRCTLIDIDPAAPDFPTLARECLLRDAEPEIVLRRNKRYVHRLRQTPAEFLEEKKRRPLNASDEWSLQLRQATSGRVETLYFQAETRKAPGMGEVEIKVHTVALHQIDMLRVTGRFDKDDGAAALDIQGDPSGTRDAELGIEASGKIARVGPGVHQFKPGDEVVVLDRGGCFSSFITRSFSEAYVVPKPGGLTLAKSPVLFHYLTAYYGLHDLARLSKGERVLINAETGGLAVAAAQYAKFVGAEVFITAASPERWNYLSGLGVDWVMDSANLGFFDQIMAITGGKGVNVVLNTLSGEILQQSFAALSSHGRFIQAGRPNGEDMGILWSQWGKNVSFSLLDIHDLLRHQRPLFSRLLQEVGRYIEEEAFSIQPPISYPASKVDQAFQYLLGSKNTGRPVVLMEDQVVRTKPWKNPAGMLEGEATYLVTGGLGGFGLEVSKWMVRQGARWLVLVGRTGASRPEAQMAIDAMLADGVQVRVRQLDIADPQAVRALMEKIRSDMPPLRGIIHSAALLDDGFLVQQSEARMRSVMNPKVMGAWNLHQSTLDQKLNFFVMFSSVASLLGTAGQGNYAAANAFLDGLAHYRRSLGLPSLTINWGALGEVGMAARNPEVMAQLDGMGIKGLPPLQALEAMEKALTMSLPQIGMAHIDWDQLALHTPSRTNTTRLAELVANWGGLDERSDSIKFRVQSAKPEQRLSLVISCLQEKVAGVLRIDFHQVDIHQSMTLLGLDSLMAAELKVIIRKIFGVEYPIIDLLSGGPILGIGKEILKKMGLVEVTA